MENIKTISDGGSPTIAEMRESQRVGSEGTGFDESYADKMASRNHGTGKGEGKDEAFPEAGAGTGSGLPFLG